MKRCLVTGGSGFLGSSLVERLLELGHAPRILDLIPPNLPGLEHQVEFIQGDVRDPAVVRQACQNVDVVFHLAALVPLTRAGKGFEDINFGGTRNVLEASLEAKIPQFIYVSTSAVYGIPRQIPIVETTECSPLDQYGRAKLKGEAEARLYRARGLKVAIIRPRTIVGTGRLGIFHILFDWIKRGKPVWIMGSGNNRLQFVSTRDFIEACVLVAANESSEDFNVGAEEYSTFRGDLESLAEHAGTGSKVVSFNAALARIALKSLDILRLSPIVDYHYMTIDKDYYFDISKAKNLLGWKPRDSNVKMLTEAYDWFVEHYSEVKSYSGATHRKGVRQGLLGIIRAFF